MSDSKNEAVMVSHRLARNSELQHSEAEQMGVGSALAAAELNELSFLKDLKQTPQPS